MSFKNYIDNTLSLNNITNVSTYKGKRQNKTDIYLIDNDNSNYKVNANLIINGTNENGNGTIIAINNTGIIYIEHLGYYNDLNKLLDNIKDFMETIVNKPIGASSQGPVTASPNLINNATTIINQIEILKKELP